MSTTAMGPHDSLEALKELQKVSDQLRQANGTKSLPDAVKLQLAEGVASVISDSRVRLEDMFQALAVLPAAILAHGAVLAWPFMADDRRVAYLSWLESPESNAAAQSVILIPALLDSFSTTATDLFARISSKSTKATKTTNKKLASSLLSGAAEKAQLLIQSDAPEHKVRKIVDVLLKLCSIPTISNEARWNVVRLALTTMVNRKIQNDSLAPPLLASIAVQLPSLTPGAKQEMRDLLVDLDEKLLERFFPSEEPPVVPPTPPRPIGPVREPDSPEPLTGGLASTLQTRLSGCLNTLQEWTAMLQGVQEHVRTLEERQTTLERQLGDAEAKHREALNTAEQNLAVADEAKRSLEQRYDSLQSRLTASEYSFAQERIDLTQRIQGNAERRLEEYRNSLANTLARLSDGLPARWSDVPPDLGGVILTRFYQAIDFLESKGVRILSGQEVRS